MGQPSSKVEPNQKKPKKKPLPALPSTRKPEDSSNKSSPQQSESNSPSQSPINPSKLQSENNVNSNKAYKELID